MMTFLLASIYENLFKGRTRYGLLSILSPVNLPSSHKDISAGTILLFKIIVKMKFIVILSIFLAVSVARAQEPSMSPEMSPEMVDPMARPSIPMLYLSSAGKGMHKEMMITPFKQITICSKDYPTGFSIRCAVMNTQHVDFYVNYKLYRTEMYKPYFLSGNLMGDVHPFTGLDTKDKVRVGCRVATRKPVWVDLIKSC